MVRVMNSFGVMVRVRVGIWVYVALSRALALAVARALVKQARPQWRESTWLGEGCM